MALLYLKQTLRTHLNSVLGGYPMRKRVVSILCRPHRRSVKRVHALVAVVVAGRHLVEA